MSRRRWAAASALLAGTLMGSAGAAAAPAPASVHDRTAGWYGAVTAPASIVPTSGRVPGPAGSRRSRLDQVRAVVSVHSAGPVLRTVAVGKTPRAVAIDARTGRAFVANYEGNSISVLNARTGLLIRTVKLLASSHPRRIVVDEKTGHVFVESVGDLDKTGALVGAGEVTMLDATSGVILSGAATGKGPLSIALDSLTGRVFVGNYDDDTVTVISALSGHALGTIDVGNSPIALGVDALRGHVFVANKYGNSVSELNAASGALIRTVTICVTPHEMAVDSLHGRIAVACWGAVDNNDNPKGKGSVELLSASTGAVLSKTRVGIYPWALAADKQTGRVFVANWGRLDKNGSPLDPGTLNTLDTMTGQILHTTTVGYGPGPLAVDLAHGRVYVANSSTVSTIDAASGFRLQGVAVGNDVEDVSVDSATNRLFAVNGQDNTVSVVDTARL